MRINPFELHIADPDYYDELYVGSSRRTSKYGWATKAFGESTSVLATESHELHRIRRAAVAPFFSKQAVQRLEPTVQSVVDKLLLRLQALQGTGECVNMVDVFTALTGDIISEYSFDRSYRLIDNPEFAPHWHKVMMDSKSWYKGTLFPCPLTQSSKRSRPHVQTIRLDAADVEKIP